VAAGFDHPLFRLLPPWTPVKSINASLGGQLSGDRPNPARHRGVLLGAAEAGSVLLRHERRHASLLASGLAVTNAGLADVGPVNAFLAGAAVVDEQGALIATGKRR